ncbi:threonine dehydrogenase-like Zn-dependent dehydrogenase [Pseudonocardia hierapolitana]|uniref:Threonine dehydrogenase-like Zn-dependent dehydrogenase n=1 Tax=Pseudonocardia hierapolitana TaxID=1128676 RepID=A0A561T052_9PSEU|nr:alcohol dehydrogenase catalytic domain-containing protein [Pseudonocardia hierapolitana]TWF80493.1 threonine dehydrogenase-like Zn-dependent dehydrogenase [Pseudonocardia hierapolitana]
MRALSVHQHEHGGTLVLDDVPEPAPDDGDLLVEAVALGVCGTDREIVAKGPRQIPAGRTGLILGHESLGRVLEAPPGSPVTAGDLVVGIVRRPDPVPCASCAAGQFDLCENGRFTERGILGRDGFGSERFRLEPDYAVRVDPALDLAGVLLEPTSVVAKAWELLDHHAVRRPRRRALILGAGPIGLLAAFLAVQRDLDVHVVDRLAHGPKPRQVRALGATYHSSPESARGTFDAVVECSGALLAEAVERTAPGGAACLVGAGDVRSAGAINPADLARRLISRNRTLIGTVNSNRRHFEAAHAALRRADPAWLDGLLTDCVPLESWPAAFDTDPERIKAVVHFTA